jgi:hypothetical protein
MTCRSQALACGPILEEEEYRALVIDRTAHKARVAIATQQAVALI